MQGYFKNGFPIGDLTKYYYSGELRERNTFKRNYRIYRNYNLSSKLKEIYSEKRVNKYPYWSPKKHKILNPQSFKITIFRGRYGDIKKEVKYDINNNTLYKTQGNRHIEYFKNKRLKSKLKWRRRFCWTSLLFWKNDCECCDYIIKYKEFNEKGLIVLKTKLDVWCEDKDYRPASFLNADWIL